MLHAALLCYKAAPFPHSAAFVRMLRLTRVATAGLFSPAQRFPQGGRSPAPRIIVAFKRLTCLQVLILYRDIIRTARVMTHNDKGASHASKLFWQREFAPT